MTKPASTIASPADQAFADQRAGISLHVGREPFATVADKSAYLNAYVKAVKTCPRALALSKGAKR